MRARQRLLLQAHVGVQVHLCGLDRFVPKPQSNDGAVNAIVEKVHGGPVSQHVGADFLAFERFAFFRGDRSVFFDDALDGVTAELPMADTEKQWIFRATVAFPEPGLQHLCRFRTERCAPMFSTLSLTVDVGACSQDDILAAQANQFGNPEPRLEEEQNHSPIAAPNPTGAIGDRQQSIHLLRVDKFDGPTFVAFAGHRQNSLAEQRMRRLLQGNVLKEGVKCGQADVPGAGAILTAALQIIEEITNKRGVQIVKREARGRFAQPLFCELKEQAERIAISRYGMGTGLPLSKQAR